jgi:hypothetical protein
MKRGWKLWNKMAHVCQWRMYWPLAKTLNEKRRKCAYAECNCRMSLCPAVQGKFLNQP